MVGYRITTIQKGGDFMRPIGFCAALASRRLTPPRERFGEHEDARSSGSLVFPPGVILRGGDHLADFLHQLHRLFVHADHRDVGIERSGVGFEDLLHIGREFGVGFGRNHPGLDLAFRHPFFFSVCRTVS